MSILKFPKRFPAKLGTLIAIFTMVLLFISGVDIIKASPGESATKTFYVGWYDVGKAALDGMQGIKHVSRGFKNFKEINTVTYDPSVVTVKEMESALKRAGTYRGTSP